MLEYVHRIAEKVANEPIDDELENWIVGDTEDGHMPLVRKPQHVKEHSYGEKKRKQTKEANKR